MVFILIIFTFPINAINYTVQTGYFKVLQNANSMTNELLDKGFNVYKHKSGNRYYVFVGEFDNWNAANNTLSEVKKVVTSAYIKKIDIELSKKEDKAVENDLEKKTVEQSNAPSKETKEQEEIKKNEEASENKDFNFYRNQTGYVFKNAYLLKINGDKYKLSFPNGAKKIYSISNNHQRKIRVGKRYLLVFKKEKLIDLLPQRTKVRFSKSLQDLGYIKDINLNPSNNEFQFSIPVSKNIIKKEIFLELYLEKAGYVENNTYLDIFINDNHLKTIKLNEPQQAHKYKIHLNNENIKITDLLNIKIKSSFSANDLNNSLNEHHEKSWINIDIQSKVHFSLKDQPTYNINNFLNMEVNEIKLLHDQNLTRNLMEKYIKVSTKLNRKYSNKVSNNYLPDDKKATDLSNINNQVRNILISEEFKTTELLDNLTLKLAPKDAEFFLSEYNDIINSNKLKLNSFNLVENENLILNSYKKNKNNNYKSGGGNIEYEYFLPGNFFKTHPKEIKLHLTGSYFIPFNNKAYLKVYLNEKLIMVEKLMTSKYFEEKIIKIPGKEIESYNDLEIVFSQIPDRNLNRFSNIMETYINPESYITYSGDIFKKNIFTNLLLNFTGKGKILITEKYKEELFNTANLFIKYIHKNDFSNLDFTIDYLKNYNIDTEEKNIKWYLIIGADKINENMKSRVNFVGNNFESTSGENEENFSINFDKSLSYIDLNTIGDKQVIFINTNSSYDNLSEMFLEINKKESIYDLEGNLLIYNGDNYKTFNIANQTPINKSEKYLNNLKTIVFKYKLQIYIVSVVLIIMFLIWIYYKTARIKDKKD
jgi:hypothetical protein